MDEIRTPSRLFMKVLHCTCIFFLFRTRKRLVIEEITSKMKGEKSKLDELEDQLEETTQ